jgi:hypothetical protein
MSVMPFAMLALQSPHGSWSMIMCIGASPWYAAPSSATSLRSLPHQKQMGIVGLTPYLR